MKNLFIDTNVWLLLYHYSSIDLTYFAKLKSHLNKTIKLYCTEQLRNEFYRNREAKLKDSFTNSEIKTKIPVYFKAYPEYKEIENLCKDVTRKFNSLKGQIKKDIESENLEADKSINELFNTAGIIECDSYVEKAFHRYKIGNPPGKDNKYGDAINWECLLQNVPDGEDLYFISDDKDYKSLLDENKMNPFLVKEWKEKKKSNIYFFTNLKEFLEKNVDDIVLPVENEKEELIKQLLINSDDIAIRGIIHQLYQYDGWTKQQIENICSAVYNNSNKEVILNSPLFKEFYNNMIKDAALKDNELNVTAIKNISDYYNQSDTELHLDYYTTNEIIDSFIEEIMPQIKDKLEEKLDDEENITLIGLEYDNDGIENGYEYDEIYYNNLEIENIELNDVDYCDEDVIAARFLCTISVEAECSYEDKENAYYDSEEDEYHFVETKTYIEKHKGIFPCSIIINRKNMEIQIVQFHVYLNGNTRQEISELEEQKHEEYYDDENEEQYDTE